MNSGWGPLHRKKDTFPSGSGSMLHPQVRHKCTLRISHNNFTAYPTASFLYCMCPFLTETWAREIAQFPVYFSLLFLSLYWPVYHPKLVSSISCFSVPPFSERALLDLALFLNSSVSNHSCTLNIRCLNINYSRWAPKIPIITRLGGKTILHTLYHSSGICQQLDPGLHLTPITCSSGHLVLTLTSNTGLTQPCVLSIDSKSGCLTKTISTALEGRKHDLNFLHMVQGAITTRYLFLSLCCNS